MKRTFETWMRATDAAVLAKVGMSVYDLPDINFRDRYENGDTANSAANAAIREARRG